MTDEANTYGSRRPAGPAARRAVRPSKVYIPWAKANKRSWYHDTRYAVVICEFFKGKTFADITPMLVEHFKKYRREGLTLRGAKRNMATVNRELAQLSKILSLATDNSYCETNPCRKVGPFRVDDKRERVLTGEEEEQLFAALVGGYASLRPVALLALHTGMRRGESMGLRWPNVDSASNVIRLPREITKSGKARTIPLNGEALAALVELKERAGLSERVLAGLGYGKSTLSKKFGKATASAGITGVTLHTLRHTFATRLKDAGVDPFTVRDLLRSRDYPNDQLLHARHTRYYAARRRSLDRDNGGKYQHRTGPPSRDCVMFS